MASLGGGDQLRAGDFTSRAEFAGMIFLGRTFAVKITHAVSARQKAGMMGVGPAQNPGRKAAVSGAVSNMPRTPKRKYR